jgi:hypothetical protein
MKVVVVELQTSVEIAPTFHIDWTLVSLLCNRSPVMLCCAVQLLSCLVFIPYATPYSPVLRRLVCIQACHLLIMNDCTCVFGRPILNCSPRVVCSVPSLLPHSHIPTSRHFFSPPNIKRWTEPSKPSILNLVIILPGLPVLHTVAFEPFMGFR